MVEERIGENMGPIDWSHEIAASKPDLWREAEKNPGQFLFNNVEIYALAMYDGWPYWKPTPAIQFAGPLGPEWTFFNSYSVRDDSIRRRVNK
jgi:hypothetical protein